MKSSAEYFLQVVKEGEEPKWPHPEDELVVGHQPFPSGYVQYWAYDKESGKDDQDLPNAEVVASQYPTSSAVILVDQPEHLKDKDQDLLELIVAKDGHAWGKTESSLANLDDNLSTILEFAKDQFNINIEHFMTTKGVSKEVEKTLDNLEEKSENSPPEEHSGIRQVNTQPFAVGLGGGRLTSDYSSKPSSSSRGASSKLMLLMPLVALILAGAGALLFKDQLFGVFGQGTPPPEVTPTPQVTPTPTSTPTPSFDRSEVKVRVLNGTTKTGAAATLGKQLEKLGWKILESGNAPKKGLLQTEVRAKEGSESAAAALVSDLSSDYRATVSANLKKTDKADLEVVIGEE
ncbi:MAG: Cell envelope-related transcriptional attenuator [Candidatus Daviesbacteria bacterium GW2011_GWA1_41_61]|uniref:Cell envelope-related transcriptional attenuator n=1 Tax=Candidatus Daviesbacteria bacterium GW2011_GWA2_40_9 TaxID=1618424 RepID=A0A0G0U009_9BACT|nr:MAG: coiled-coil [Candidatus Daviesbacteria bacterium GW2011_GWC1_40_9]KKR82423.1 MAG: Cell envelope-related transcriptional attenuator [Candidatus Daviesbacteria bacterium GW2011_GWA2_40_9]KKR92381.1 MAG: Cell envelope-related transcriptional attenuator [Candidatus Daviesbacteria bacterium GW2011_GWB1_41_15]KKS14569.1 MAG: Cell envelope-related transcriptional attenuator [Candidatus Daviesbacteria bacterium GW2011_GWA1_41_61]